MSEDTAVLSGDFLRSFPGMSEDTAVLSGESLRSNFDLKVIHLDLLFILEKMLQITNWSHGMTRSPELLPVRHDHGTLHSIVGKC